MKTLLWAERIKLKRSKILWIAAFSAIMVAVIVFMQGQFIYNGHRYVDGAGWFMTATQSLGSLYVFPAIIALMGSYMICRENQDDTLKSLSLIPISISKLIGAKIVVTAILSVGLYGLLFVITLIIEASLHLSLLNSGMVLSLMKTYLLEGFLLFVAVSPIIAIVYRLKKGYWIALVFAEIYSFLGLFMGMQSTMRSIYPITAAFCVAGYYKTNSIQIIISLCSLLICVVITFVILKRFDNMQKDR